MKKTELQELQEMREEATGNAKVKIQGKIDEHFFGDPKRRKKKKKKIKMDFEEDMW